MLTPEYLDILRKASLYNRRVVESGARCGCFHCKEMFEGAQVSDWFDKGLTAVCPKCGIDSVISEASPGVGQLTPEALTAMYDRWFNYK